MVLLSALILGSSALLVYFADAHSLREDQGAAPNIASLENTISSLEGTNLALRAQISALGSNSQTSAVSASGLTAQQIYASSNRSVVTIQGDQTTTVSTFFGPQTTVTAVLGSGFVTTFKNSSYIITNYHVVAGDSNLTVTFPDGNAYPASVVGTDPYSDLAVLTVQGASHSEFKSLVIVSSLGITVGQQVYAIGNPYGLAGSMTVGIISQLGRTIQDPVAGNFSVAGAIQFSAPINPGNSGGPLLNENGQVIGITTATVTSSQGIGFAIPSSAIMRVLPSLIATGTYSHYSYLGINTVDMNYQLAQASHSNVTYGVLVEGVVAGSPASKSGLRAGSTTVTIAGSPYLVGGDIIISVNGTKIASQDALSTYLALNTVAGQTVNLRIVRSGGMTTVPVALGTRPPP
jgi:S1-C subfamily serine protease